MLLRGLGDGDGWSTVLLPLAMLGAMIIVFGALATTLFRRERN